MAWPLWARTSYMDIPGQLANILFMSIYPALLARGQHSLQPAACSLQPTACSL